MLSYGGKLTLIKSVLASILIHILAVSTPPKRVFRILEKKFGDFLWDSSEYGLRFHWFKWSSICRLIEKGVLGCDFYSLSLMHLQ